MITIRKKQSAPKLWSGTPGTGSTTIEAESWTETYVDGSKVVLNWTAPVVFTNGSYQIYKAGSFLVTVPGSQTSYEDMNVASGTTYEYHVYLVYSS